MYKLVLILFAFLLSSVQTQAQCDLALDEVDEFEQHQSPLGSSDFCW